MRGPKAILARGPETLADLIARSPAKAGFACAVVLFTALALGNAHAAVEDARRALAVEMKSTPTVLSMNPGAPSR